jgi:uncharacterized cupredoxin-like copper-binding protein
VTERTTGRSGSMVMGALVVIAAFVVVLGGATATVLAVDASNTGAKGSTVKVMLSEYSIAISNNAHAGDVTFVVTNEGSMEHEMLVLQTDTPADQLEVTDAGDPPVPVTSGADKIDEETSIAETGDPNLKHGDTRTFTIADMAPGHYVLVCNLADHYQLGMRLDFTVAP